MKNETNGRRRRIALGFMIAAFCGGAPVELLAADLTQFSSPATGSDMWNGMMARSGMYTPHPNNCDATEVFVAVASAPDGVSLGLCVEKNQREGTASWIAARHTCLAAKKRLPEPGEFSYACANAAGLNDMTNDWEWATSFSFNVVPDAVNVREGVAATAMGSGSCTKAGTGWVANTDDTPSTFAYRCVR
jgi:hypothetical protein